MANKMIKIRYSISDCEYKWKCPNCDYVIGDWDFLYRKLKPGDIFICDKCKSNLIVPDPYEED